jgi:hypothetical protein
MSIATWDYDYEDTSFKEFITAREANNIVDNSYEETRKNVKQSINDEIKERASVGCRNASIGITLNEATTLGFVNDVVRQLVAVGYIARITNSINVVEPHCTLEIRW